MAHQEKLVWEVTFCDTGRTVYWTTRKCNSHFGRDEFNEIRQGYGPNIVAVQVPASEAV